MNKRKKITNLFILDASSSMLKGSKHLEVRDSLEKDLKDIRARIKKDESDITTIVCQFSSRGEFKVLVNSMNSRKELKGITENYKPSGMTALRNAIKKGFELIPEGQDAVIVDVLTDGGENNSGTETTVEDVKELLSMADKNKWAVTFTGASADDITSAREMGFEKNIILTSNDSLGFANAGRTRRKSKAVYYSRVMNAKSKAELDNDNLLDNSDLVKN